MAPVEEPNTENLSENSKESGDRPLLIGGILIIILPILAILLSIWEVAVGNQVYGLLISTNASLFAVVVLAFLNGVIFEPSRAKKEREHQRRMGREEQQYQRLRDREERDYQRKRDKQEREYQWQLDRQEQTRKAREEHNKAEAQKTGLRNALYSEMAHTYYLFKNLLSHQPNVSSLGDLPDVLQSRAEIGAWLGQKVDPATINAISCFDVWQYTRKDPVLFYQLSDAQAIDSFYKGLMASVDPEASNAPIGGAPFAPQTLFWIKFFVSELETLIVEGGIKLDIDLLKQFAENKYCLQYLTTLEEQPEMIKKEFALLTLVEKAIKQDGVENHSDA